MSWPRVKKLLWQLLSPPDARALFTRPSFASLADYVGPEPEAWVFRSPTGVVPRKSNWSVHWRKVTAAVGIEGLHFHDLRHTGNTLAASTGASTKELMSRMGHASTRAAILYQHATRERDDAIAAGLDRIITTSAKRRAHG